MPDVLIADQCRRALAAKRITGIALCGGPFEMEIIIDFTGPRGSGSNLYYAYVFQLPKWDYKVKKVDEWIEVTPEWVEYYNLTIAQKQKLMETIKAGLMSAAQAVADYELLAHDARRYREILDYFKAGKKDEHVLRSLFVDRVDAYTGEGYSLITMARRWPTIISDFLRMRDEWTDVNEIRRNLDVPLAEAAVLKTKNELYKEWKRLFLPALKERYARIQAMAEARKKSIEEYKKWLKPYVSRFKMIKEKLESAPTSFVNDPYMNPGFGQSQAVAGVKVWCWKPFIPPELRKPAMGPLREFKFKGTDGKIHKIKFLFNPYDKLVKEWKQKIEERYGIAIPDAKVYEILESAYASKEMDPSKPYYVFFEANVFLSLMRTPPPEGIELDDLMFAPLKAWFISQNVLLIHLIELYAREKAFEKYIEELIGGPSLEKEIFEKVEKEFEEEKPKPVRFAKMRAFYDRFAKITSKLYSFAERFFYIFVKRGPYEPVFRERVTKVFARGIGKYYGQQVNFIKSVMGAK